MADNMRENTQLEDELMEKGKNKVKSAGKHAVKGAFGKLADKLGLNALKKKILMGVGLVFAMFSVVILLYVIALAGWQFLKDVWEYVVRGTFPFFAVVFDLDTFDEEALNKWRESEDPYKTFQLYTAMKKQYEHAYEGGEAVTVDGVDLDEEALKTAKDAEEALEDVIEYEQPLLAPEDMLYFIESVNEENESMFKYRTIFYNPQVWALSQKDNAEQINTTYVPPTKWWWEWEKTEFWEGLYNTRDDEKYGIVTNENFHGEKVGDERIYALRWPEVMALGYFYSTEKYGQDGWGKSPDSKYDYTEERTGDDGTTYALNNTEDYYLDADERKKIFEMFTYDFEDSGNYYYDAVSEGKNHETPGTAYTFHGFSEGAYTVGYRYDRYVRYGYHDDIYLDKSNPGGDKSYTERSPYNQSADPGYEPLTTEFVPDIAPKSVKNKINTYIYYYIPTDKVPDYTPDPDCFEPPEASYCIGKWQIVDPQPFIEDMADLCHYYTDYDSEYNRESKDYKWAADLIDRYAFYLDFIADSTDTPASKGDYYRDLVELYTNKQIDVYYYGMRAEPEVMEEYVLSILEAYPGKSIRFLNYDSSVEYGEFYEVDHRDVKEQAADGTIPFPCYGVSFRDKTGVIPSDSPGGNTHIEGNYVGEFYVSEHGSHRVDGWAKLQEGADEPLDGGYSYTRDQIARALSALQAKGSSYTFPSGIHAGKTYTFDWAACVDDIHQYCQDTGIDVIGLLAIVYTEYTPRVGFATWNWFNLTTKDGTVFHREASDEYDWWDIAADVSMEGYSTKEGACMVEAMKSIVRRYWRSDKYHQNTYFKMSWNQYGWDPVSGVEDLPQDWDSAVAAEATMESAGHCYCPWWDDAYVKNGYDSYYLWCNVCARNRAMLRKTVGADSSETEEEEP